MIPRWWEYSPGFWVLSWMPRETQPPRPLGVVHASCDYWVNIVTDQKGNEGSLEANKAACEASVKQSIRELAAWVEEEDAK